ncbi:MAG: hypothetical protein ACE5K4_08255 [Candidatus Hydrothermarchaeota archaeon]
MNAKNIAIILLFVFLVGAAYFMLTSEEEIYNVELLITPYQEHSELPPNLGNIRNITQIDGTFYLDFRTKNPNFYDLLKNIGYIKIAYVSSQGDPTKNIRDTVKNAKEVYILYERSQDDYAYQRVVQSVIETSHAVGFVHKEDVVTAKEYGLLYKTLYLLHYIGREEKPVILIKDPKKTDKNVIVVKKGRSIEINAKNPDDLFEVTMNLKQVIVSVV